MGSVSIKIYVPLSSSVSQDGDVSKKYDEGDDVLEDDVAMSTPISSEWQRFVKDFNTTIADVEIISLPPKTSAYAPASERALEVLALHLVEPECGCVIFGGEIGADFFRLMTQHKLSTEGEEIRPPTVVVFDRGMSNEMMVMPEMGVVMMNPCVGILGNTDEITHAAEKVAQTPSVCEDGRGISMTNGLTAAADNDKHEAASPSPSSSFYFTRPSAISTINPSRFDTNANDAIATPPPPIALPAPASSGYINPPPPAPVATNPHQLSAPSPQLTHALSDRIIPPTGTSSALYSKVKRYKCCNTHYLRPPCLRLGCPYEHERVLGEREMRVLREVGAKWLSEREGGVGGQGNGGGVRRVGEGESIEELKRADGRGRDIDGGNKDMDMQGRGNGSGRSNEGLTEGESDKGGKRKRGDEETEQEGRDYQGERAEVTVAGGGRLDMAMSKRARYKRRKKQREQKEKAAAGGILAMLAGYEVGD